MYNIIILLEYGSVAWDPYNPIFWQYLQHRKRKHVTRLGHFRLLTICHFSLNQQVLILASVFANNGFTVKSPDWPESHLAQSYVTQNQSCVVQNFGSSRLKYWLIMLNSIHASLLHIYCASFISSKIKEWDIVLIYRTCFVVHQGLKREIYITHLYCFFHLIVAERTRHVIHSFLLFHLVMV